MFDYTLNGVQLQRPEYIRDLGVTYDSKLNFIKHIENISSSAFRSLGMVLRNSKDLQDLNVVQLLYYSYVRSRLEYGSIIWNPIYQIHIDSLEKIQRRFLKYIVFSADGVYPPRGIFNDYLLQKCEFHSLLHRRTITAVTMLYNILHSSVVCEDLLGYIQVRTLKQNLRSSTLLEIPLPRTTVLRSFPLYHMLQCYANLDSKIDIFSCSISPLRSHLKIN